METNGVDDYPQEIRDNLYEITENLQAISPYVTSNLRQSSDFLTALVGWRTQRTLQDRTQRSLLKRLSDPELGRFQEVSSMIGAGESFEEIDRISTNGNLVARVIFERAKASISSQERIASRYTNEVNRIYANMRDVLTWYQESKGDFKYASDNPFFSKLVEIYTATQDPFLLEVILPEFIPFAVKVARDTMRGRFIAESGTADEEDYIAAGLSRGVSELHRFQPWIGIKITTFLGPRFAGAVLDEARELDLLSRTERERTKQYQRILEREDSRLRVAKTEDEIAEEMGITTRELREIILLTNLKQLSLQGPYYETDKDDKPITLDGQLAFTDPMDQFTICTPETEFLREERIGLLEKAIKQLSPEQNKLFHAYYTLGMEFREIGESGYLGRRLTQSRTCQMMVKTRKDLERKYKRLLNS